MCETKICTKCGEEKNIDQFDRHKKYKSGRRSSCKSCRAEYRRKNRDDIYEKQKEYRKKTGYKPKYKSKSRDWISERQKKLINKIKAKFGDQYDLSKVVYQPSQRKITIGCSVHGFLSVTKYDFFKNGCPKCSNARKYKKYSDNKMIDKAKQKHGWWFDLSLYHIRVKKTKQKAYKRVVICPIHGPFLITAGQLNQYDCACPHCLPTYRLAAKGLLHSIKDDKQCTKCGIIKPIINYGSRIRNNKKVLDSYCKDCRRESYKVAKYKRRSMVKNNEALLNYEVDRTLVFIRDKWKCCECGKKVQDDNPYQFNSAELDHIIPQSKGGSHSYSNLQTLCRPCNTSKNNRLLNGIQIDIWSQVNKGA